MAKEDLVRGTPEEREIYWQVKRHYDMSTEDLEVRIRDWNKKDDLFRSHIPDEGWPYSAQVFDPRVFTAIFEKSARMMANKPKGRLIPREGGDAISAKILNSLLDFQWDEAERIDEEPMLAKWTRMDMNTRKYGASFALCKWHYEERVVGEQKTRVEWFDGPSFKPWNTRDVLVNPSYSHIKNWIQLREWPTLEDLKSVNDAARKKPVYKNLDILQDALTKEAKKGGDSRTTSWQSRNLSIKGLNDYLGQDETFKVFEMITEYRNDRWITFAPRHGIILRDIPNPYIHGRIPVIQLKYYPIDEDIYGLSEIEPVEKLQRAINALVNQYLDAINMSLYTPIKVRTASVQLHTLEFGPGKKWLMSDPSSDVLPYETSAAGVAEFASTYKFLVGALQEALGETSAAVSQMVPGEGERTATEIKELSLQRNARDNFNQLFLTEALKDQMNLWLMMDKQFLFDGKSKQKVINIVGQEAVKFFQDAGLDGMELSQEVIDQLTSPEMEEVISDPNFDINALKTPVRGVETDEGAISKLHVEDTGNEAKLIIEESDLSGNYDYIPDVRSMSNPEPALVSALTQMVAQAKDPAANQLRLQSSGKIIDLVQLEKDLFELLGLKDADKYYKDFQDPNTGAVAGAPEGQVPMGSNPTPGLQGNPQAIPRN